MGTRILFNDLQIKHKTKKATLIKLPRSMKSFWLPNSLISYHTDHTQIGYLPDGFDPYSGSSRPIGLNEVIDAFEQQSAVLPKITKHKPDTIKPVKAHVDDDLKR